MMHIQIKDIILKEGFRSVVSNGIKSFTVENLASKLSMSKKTIYQYFPKKECPTNFSLS